MAQQHHITHESREYLKELFEAKDEDHTGYINKDELAECLFAVGFCPTNADVEFLHSHFDVNGDGQLSINELLDNIEVISTHSLNGDELMKAFQKFDLNDDGFIRLPELREILLAKDGFTAEEASKLLDMLVRKFDANGDGKFNYKEFVQIFLASGNPFKRPAKK